MTIKAVAFDPGLTTGYAVGYLDDGFMAVKAGQAKWTHLDLWAELQLSQPDYVIWERFVFRKRSQHEGVELYPRELIGVLHLYVQVRNQELNHSCVAVEQMPMKSDGSYYTDDKISKDGLWIRGKPHGMDALRHLLYWFTFGSGYQYNTKGYRAA